MSISSALPIGEPSVVPAGVYTATIRGEVAEQTSKFDSSRTYYTLPLRLKNQEGEEFEFVWAFSSRSPVYIRFLETLGGVASPSGKVHPPMNYEGRTFQIKLNEQMNKDKTRLVNSVLEVWADSRKAVKEHREDVRSKSEEDGIDVPF